MIAKTLLPLLLAAATASEGPKPRIEVDYDRPNSTVIVTNNEPVPYTLNFDFYVFENTAVNCDIPCFKVVPPKSTTRLLTFRRKQRNQPWSARYKYNYRIGDYGLKLDAKHVYELPYTRGEAFAIGQGYNGSFTHVGTHRYALDFIMAEGTPIYAARAGTVAWVIEHNTLGGADESFRPYTNYVLVLHNDGSLGFYGHLSHQGVAVQAGEKVDAGQLLAWSGNTGHSTRPHLHFEVRYYRDGMTFETIPILFRTQAGPALLKEKTTYQRP